MLNNQLIYTPLFIRRRQTDGQDPGPGPDPGPSYTYNVPLSLMADNEGMMLIAYKTSSAGVNTDRINLYVTVDRYVAMNIPDAYGKGNVVPILKYRVANIRNWNNLPDYQGIFSGNPYHIDLNNSRQEILFQNYGLINGNTEAAQKCKWGGNVLAYYNMVSNTIIGAREQMFEYLMPSEYGNGYDIVFSCIDLEQSGLASKAASGLVADLINVSNIQAYKDETLTGPYIFAQEYTSFPFKMTMTQDMSSDWSTYQFTIHGSDSLLNKMKNDYKGVVLNSLVIYMPAFFGHGLTSLNYELGSPVGRLT